MVLHYCIVSCDFSILIFNVFYLILLPFLLDESGQWFVNFIYLLKDSAFSFVDFCYSLFCFFCIYFCPNLLFLSFYLPWCYSFLPFLVTLGVELGYLFDFFPLSWGKPVLLWTFPQALLLQCPIGLGLLFFHFNFFLCIFWFIFYLFCDTLVNQKCVVQPPYVGIFNIFSSAIDI